MGVYRYMTDTEAEKAHTLPIGYTSCVSSKHSATMIGNGWTVDVIVHIFSCLWNLD